jgi:flagellar hook-length control protein FliK
VGRGGAPRAPDGGTLAAEEPAAGTADSPIEKHPAGREASAPATDPAADPAALLAELRARVSTGSEARTAAAGLVGAEGRPPAGASPLAGRAQAGEGRQGRAVPAAGGTGAASPAPGAAEAEARTLLQPLTDAQTLSASETPAGRADASAPPLAPALAGVLPGAAGSVSSTAPVAEARLAAAPGSADFSNQLGAQLTTFVREGVQQARLHLHPAELGPVTVRIQIDGQAAQVHMAAEHALTRQALEQSMPLLAGNLREAGLTLSGGGVFEQPRQRDGGDTPGQPGAGAGTGSASGGEPGASTPLHGATGAPARRGVVDLVA